MTNIKKGLILWALLLSLPACSPIGEQASAPSAPVVEARYFPEESAVAEAVFPTAIGCPSFDRELFAMGVGSPASYELDSPPLAGMVPHHLIASDMIAGFFSLAARWGESYDTVLLVSPSHFPENCGSDVVTTTASWNTPVGIVATDMTLVSALLNHPHIGAEDNPAAVESDHGVTGLIPFVRHYLPDAQVAVCLLANKLSRDRLGEVQDVFNKYCESSGKRVLLVASADCSHYLSPADAAQQDTQTAAAIESFDRERILAFTDSNVDSPQAVTSFLSRAQGSGMSLHRLGHGSSADILPHAQSNPVYLEGVTTYFVYGATGEGR